MRRHEDTVSKIFDDRPSREEMKSELSQFMRKKQAEIRKFTNQFQKMSQVKGVHTFFIGNSVA